MHSTATAFQWAPTLGGECYLKYERAILEHAESFNGHPPLGVNATCETSGEAPSTLRLSRFNGHPPLGVNATYRLSLRQLMKRYECFNGHPPLGVNATQRIFNVRCRRYVSMGTHPWG